jgi:hypothetical protein
MILVIILAALVVLAVVVVVVWRSRLHTSDIEERSLPTGHVDLVRPPDHHADAAECAICGEVFETPEDLDRHVAQYHPSAEPRA